MIPFPPSLASFCPTRVTFLTSASHLKLCQFSGQFQVSSFGTSVVSPFLPDTCPPTPSHTLHCLFLFLSHSLGICSLQVGEGLIGPRTMHAATRPTPAEEHRTLPPPQGGPEPSTRVQRYSVGFLFLLGGWCVEVQWGLA